MALDPFNWARDVSQFEVKPVRKYLVQPVNHGLVHKID